MYVEQNNPMDFSSAQVQIERYCIIIFLGYISSSSSSKQHIVKKILYTFCDSPLFDNKASIQNLDPENGNNLRMYDKQMNQIIQSNTFQMVPP